MTDEKLKTLWGEELYNYCYQKSIELIGYPEFQTMLMVAVAKLSKPPTVGVNL